MASRKKSRRSRPSRLVALLQAAGAQVAYYLAGLSRAAAVLALSAGALWGLHAAEGRVHRFRDHPRTVRFQLPGVPPALEYSIRARLSDLQQASWNDPTLCREVHERLVDDGWIAEVLAVGKGKPGEVYVECRYRHPLALVRAGEYFYLVDESGFRLPGEYDHFDPDWVVIEGTRIRPPEPWGQWAGDDIAAGVRLARLLAKQPFAHQIGVLQLHNYGGREDRRRAHVELLTSDGQARVLWGSAPGEELEENTAAQKIDILAANFRRHGRIDAGHPTIDVSVFPDRFIVPGS